MANGLGEFFLGTPAKTQQFPLYTPQQQGLQNQAITQALSMLKGMGNQGFNFAPIAEQRKKEFQTAIVPGLAERFTSLGSQGSQRSSAFPAALGAAATGLESDLAALQAQYGFEQQGREQNMISNLLGLGLRPSFETGYTQSKPGFLQQGSQLLLQLLPLLLGGFLGGPTGAMAGGSLGALSGLGGR